MWHFFLTLFTSLLCLADLSSCNLIQYSFFSFQLAITLFMDGLNAVIENYFHANPQLYSRALCSKTYNCYESNEPSILVRLNVMIADFISWLVCPIDFIRLQCVRVSMIVCMRIWNLKNKMIQNVKSIVVEIKHKSRNWCACSIQNPVAIISEIIILKHAMHHTISKVHKLRDRGVFG